MVDKLESESGTEGILFRQGKLIGHLEDLKASVNKLDIKVDRNYEATIVGIKEVLIKCEENSIQKVKTHADTCPMIDKLDLHLVRHNEKDKYKKENEIRQEINRNNKIGWFKWLISIILGLLGIKGIWDIIFHTSNKINQQIDKIIK